jgi:hypothetical protein
MVVQLLRELPTLAICFLRELPQLYNIKFYGTIIGRTWQIAKNFERIATMEN